MATTTTNFGWDIPQSTDLVKDGATAIAALGQDIDTAFVDFKGGTTGQVLKKTSGTDLDVEWGTASSGLTLINTTSFSAVASQSISDVFSATYDRYLIATEISSASANVDILMRLRVSGSDATGSDYSYAGSGWRATNAQFTPVSTGTTSFDVGRAGVAYVCHAQINVVNPFKTVKTVVLGQYGAKDSVSTFVNPFAGNHDLATSYTGFTLFPNTGTMTGSVRVYGYAN
jgi:hypothetical protein